MVTAIDTRTFGLKDLDIDPEIRTGYIDTVNYYIKEGILLDYHFFERDSLKSVKTFFDQIEKCQCELKDRIHRCAAQTAYFAIQGYRRNQQNLILMIDDIRTHGWFNSELKTKLAGVIPYYEIDNKLGFLKNQFLPHLQDLQFDLNKFNKNKTEQKKYESLINKTFKKTMIKLEKSFIRREIIAMNRRFKELLNGNTSHPSNEDKTILGILGLKTIKDVRYVGDKQWNNAKIAWKQSIGKFSKNICDVTNWGTKFASKRIINQLIKDKEPKIWTNGATFKDYMNFVKLEFDNLLFLQQCDFFKKELEQSINSELSKLRLDLERDLPDCLKIPKTTKFTIPLGIGEDVVAKLTEMEKEEGQKYADIEFQFSARSHKFLTTKLKDPDRYWDLINMGYIAKRGVLSQTQNGQCVLHIPFAIKVSDWRDNDITASGDLGLKTYNTIVINNKKKEIARAFLNQKQFDGKKDKWFLNPTSLKTVNLKGKLRQHRWIARKEQSMKMQSHRRSKQRFIHRRNEKDKWRKIKNIHKEMIRQIATRTVAMLDYYEVSLFVMEDLRWSHHTPKSVGGYYLATWQIHWFFAQVQEMIEAMCTKIGIKVQKVNPRDSSKLCHKCGERGVRSGKTFTCKSESCKLYQIDSDLNAARNLIQRSRKYKKFPDC